MSMKTLEDLKEYYEIDFDEIIQKIKKSKSKQVLLQFPDGLKLYATAVVDFLQEKFPSVMFIIWLGSCFGACDVPPVKHIKDLDLIIQFGHSSWPFDIEKI